MLILKKTLKFLLKTFSLKGYLLIINFNPKFNDLVNFMTKVNPTHFSCSNHFVSGTLTNWNPKRLNKYANLAWVETKVPIEPITKYKKLKKRFHGFNHFDHKPSVIFIIQYNHEKTHNICSEAHKLNIPIISLINSNSTSFIDFPIKADSNCYKTVFFYLKTFICISFWSKRIRTFA